MMIKQLGFSLIEVMIAMAVVAILSSIALPAYQEQIRTGKRTEAQNLILEIASKEQRFHSDNMQFTNNLVNLGYPNPLTTESGAYTITIVTAGGGASFTITATADANQTKDNCGNLTLTNTGVKGKSGTKALAECWK